MGVRHSLWVVVAVSWLCLQAQLLRSQQDLVCNSSDSKALLDLMSNFKSPVDGWGLNVSADCCDWLGVVCDSSSSLGLSDGSPGSGRVVELVLASKKLAGNISDSIGKLDQLRFLNLSHNLLHSTLPKSLLHLPNLLVLDLSYNDFYGLVSESANLPSLRVFNISENSFNENSLNGPIWPEFGNLKNVHILDLRNNFLSGSIPNSLSGMTTLEALDLSHNNLSGSIPTSLVRLNFLSKFSVAYNNLTGPIPYLFQFEF